MLTPAELITALKEGRYTVVESYLKHTYLEDKKACFISLRRCMALPTGVTGQVVEKLRRLSKKRADNFMKESKRYFSIVLAA
ncbi:MAG: hypothetical protein OEZ22_07610 [Spirochaetia bacterium]|nr:hypothetical protein [Spirochaetia bacterium]